METNVSEVVPDETPAQGSQDIETIDIVLDETVDVPQHKQLSRVVSVLPELRRRKLEESLKDISHARWGDVG